MAYDDGNIYSVELPNGAQWRMISSSTDMRNPAEKMCKVSAGKQTETNVGQAAEAFGQDAGSMMRVAAALANATASSSDPQAAAQLGNLVLCLCQQTGKRLCAKNFCLGAEIDGDGCPRVLSGNLPPSSEA